MAKYLFYVLGGYTMNVESLSLDAQECLAIEHLLNEILQEHPTVSASAFLLYAQLVAHELPRRVRTEIYRFKLTECATALCIKNNRVSSDLGSTPTDIPCACESLNREEVLHLLYCSLVGEPFAWSSIQNGNLINEVIPIAENADKPMSSGSTNLFDLHTEDAFHPLAGDYLGLFCLRNPTKTPTFIASIDDVSLSETSKRVLSEPRFIISANVAHDVAASDRRVPILFGSTAHPYFRINTNVEPGLSGDREAMVAYRELTDQLRTHAVALALEPGDCFILDNLRAAHGRPPYQPEYSGSDRWLKRIYITMDLRKSRHLRTAPESRVINPQTQCAYA
jgi:hypothetical protein